MTESIQAKKSLGQHFLVDENCCAKIVRFAQVAPDEPVLEIGAGSGRLTRHLLRAGCRVTALEMDRDLVHHLNRLASAFLGRLEVVPADVLSADWDRLLTAPKVKVVGNLPYNISTRIIREMIPLRNRFHSLTFMLQKEVAERLLAGVGDRRYGYITVLTASHFEKRRGFDVAPGCFRPIPRVSSHVLQLVPTHVGPGAPDLQRIEDVLAASFRSPRKMLLNNLRSSRFSNRPLEAVLSECGIASGSRPHQVTLEQFSCLAEML